MKKKKLNPSIEKTEKGNVPRVKMKLWNIKEESWASVLSARHDDDDDDYIISTTNFLKSKQ